jgi:hypothetical protein
MEEWICEHDGRPEMLRYVAKGDRVEHLVSGRRKLENCRQYTTEREARQG